jgi:predicted nucleic acid-binding protein
VVCDRRRVRPASRRRGRLLHRAGGPGRVTTDLVVAETWALLSSHLGRPAALTFWETLREARIPILAPDAADLEAAWRIAGAYADQAFSFVDCVSFALMERSGIAEAFALDNHFLVYRYGARRERAVLRHP